MKHVIPSQMNDVCYDKTVEFLRKGKQVMVFVHARNATVKTGMTLKEMAQNKVEFLQSVTKLYRVTHHIVSNLPLAPKQMLGFRTRASY